MTELIPEDIMKAASVVAFQIAGNLANDSMRYFIAVAILSERKRCAEATYAIKTCSHEYDEDVGEYLLRGV